MLGAEKGWGMRIRSIDENHCLASHRNVALLVWGKETLAPAVESARKALLELGKRSPAGIGLFIIVEEHSQLPAAGVRKALAGLLSDSGSHVKRSLVVQEGHGFAAAAIRGVVTGLMLLARPSSPHHVFDTVDAAAGWLVTGLPPDEGTVVGRTELLEAVAELRSKFDAQRRSRG